jgi:DNA repair exonuclease SbcCD nuclease subunit
MTEQLFKKLLWITDVHFGRSGNSPIAHQDSLDFLDWAIERAKSWGAETVIFGGDWHDNRHMTHTSTIHASLSGMDKLNSSFKNIFWLLGNHDLLHREKRDAPSIEFARNVENITIIRDPITAGDVTFLPWLVGDEHKTIRHLKSRYVFGHLEMPGFKMNEAVVMADSPHLLKADQFDKQDMVFSGHFHIRQTEGRVVYTGNTMPFNFSDAWDEDRGIMLLEWGKQPIFEAWSEQPLFRTTKLSTLLADPSILRPKSTIRAQEIREALEKEYGVRKLELIPMGSPDVNDQEFRDERITYKSVDQMVIDGIMSVQSKDISPERLVEIYQSLV